jgi:hypothetical protein
MQLEAGFLDGARLPRSLKPKTARKRRNWAVLNGCGKAALTVVF